MQVLECLALQEGPRKKWSIHLLVELIVRKDIGCNFDLTLAPRRSLETVDS